ncbi:Na+/H+ antiporter subunit C [Malaciobacter marinus]|uniref:Na+/H+ antiporter subunit C n=1 Tax=Malaciobacter marinus TaxID=505249 RepID=UPI0010131AA8|nr:Na+/H+ antiporter subunit C [Malaciobacter halophilus]RYA24543.1 Na+/H+ antiporter subunit C [Malaciobacter halophilus]
MEILLALIIAVLTGVGVFLTLRARTFPVVLGLTFLAYAVNLFLFAMGRLNINQAAIIQENVANYSDPLPQALVLTAIVISFGMTAFVIVLSLKAYGELKSDHVDGKVLDKDGDK